MDDYSIHEQAKGETPRKNWEVIGEIVKCDVDDCNNGEPYFLIRGLDLECEFGVLCDVHTAELERTDEWPKDSYDRGERG